MAQSAQTLFELSPSHFHDARKSQYDVYLLMNCFHLVNVRFFIRPNNSMLAYKLSSLAVLELRFPKVVNFEGTEAVLKRCSVKKLFLLISQNSQVFSCKFC